MVTSCYYSPTGFALQDEHGRCTCDPCNEAGERISAKERFHWNRRIKRILRKNSGIYNDYDDYEYGLSPMSVP